MAMCCLQVRHFGSKDTNRLKVKRWQEMYHAYRNWKGAGVSILILEKQISTSIINIRLEINTGQRNNRLCIKVYQELYTSSMKGINSYKHKNNWKLLKK